MNIVKQTRFILEISQEEMAGLVGCSLRQISNLESGKTKTSKTMGMFCLLILQVGIEAARDMEQQLTHYDIKGEVF